MEKHRLQKGALEAKQSYHSRLETIIYEGIVALGIAIGHRVGLFKELKKCESPVTIQQLANNGNFKERYVQEWLGSMVAAEIVRLTDDNMYIISSDMHNVMTLQDFSTLLLNALKTFCFAKECFNVQEQKDPHETIPDVFEYLNMKRFSINQQGESTDADKRLESFMDKSFLGLGIAIGHKVGLFKELKKCQSPITVKELSSAGKFKERYVKEWAESMVTAKMINKTEDNKYFIPDNIDDVSSLYIFSLLLPVAAEKIDDLHECLKKEGPNGFNYSKQSGVYDYLEEEKQMYTGNWLDQNLIPDKVKPRDEIKTILDVGCGTGRSTINLAKHFSGSAFVTGIDVIQSAISKANTTKENENISNVEFLTVGAESMSDEWEKRFDWVVAVDVLHDLPDIESSIRCIRKVLKEDGVFTALEPAVHSEQRDNVGLLAPAAYLTISCCVCLPCSMSCQPASSLGIGWGLENRASFLGSEGFKIIGEEIAGMIHCKKNLN